MHKYSIFVHNKKDKKGGKFVFTKINDLTVHVTVKMIPMYHGS